MEGRQGWRSQLCKGDCRWSSDLRFLTPAPQWSNCLPGSSCSPLGAFFWWRLCLFRGAPLRWKCPGAPGSLGDGWMDGWGSGRSTGYSRDIPGLRGAKKTFWGTPNPWSASKHHNLCAQLTRDTRRALGVSLSLWSQPQPSHEANVPGPKKINYAGSDFQQLWSIKLHIWGIRPGVNPWDPARKGLVAPPAPCFKGTRVIDHRAGVLIEMRAVINC